MELASASARQPELAPSVRAESGTGSAI
jgi:hypothetical protein